MRTLHLIRSPFNRFTQDNASTIKFPTNSKMKHLGCDVSVGNDEVWNRKSDCFTVKRTACGLGAFADHFLPRLTLILVEDPIIRGEEISHAKILHKNGTHKSRNDDDNYLREIIQMKDKTRNRLWKMHDQFVNSYSSPHEKEKRLYGIIESNAFFSTDENKLGLYPIAARLNHSCSPNVGYGFDGWTLRMFTVRDVQAGEELTDCYSDVVYHSSRAFRQEYIEQKFNFHCQCLATCRTNNFNFIKESDERRIRLKFLTMMLGARSDHIKNNPVCTDLDMLLESIHLLEVEGINHNMATLYQFAYEIASKLNAVDVIRDKKLDTHCMSLLEVSKGHNHPVTKAFREKLLMDEVSDYK